MSLGQHPVPNRSRRRGAGDGRTPREDVAADRDADLYDVARKIVLDQLSLMPRSRAELAGRLAQRGVPEEVAGAVLDRMEEVNLVDDTQFAQSWVSSRHRSRGLATRSLALELHRKGIDREVAEKALGDLDPETERATARSWVDRKLRSTAGQDPAKRTRKLVGMLARKGYPAGLAYAVVREALQQEGAELPESIDLG